MKKRNWMYRLSSKSMSVMAALALMVTTMDGSTGTHGDNHGNQPFLHVVFRTGQDAGRFQKTQKVLNHDEMAQPPYG